MLGTTFWGNLGPFILVWESLTVMALCLLSWSGLHTTVSVAGIVAGLLVPAAILFLWKLEQVMVATGMVTLTDPDGPPVSETG